MFNPGLSIRQILKNSDIVDTFKCGNMGGMRRSKNTNILVLITDYTKGIYHDKWIGGILHYTGMGKNGDQDINWAQNATLANYGRNGVDIHLFEVMDAGEYIYCGRIELITKPYVDTQPGEDGQDRKVWMFPFVLFRIMMLRNHQCLCSKTWKIIRHVEKCGLPNYLNTKVNNLITLNEKGIAQV